MFVTMKCLNEIVDKQKDLSTCIVNLQMAETKEQRENIESLMILIDSNIKEIVQKSGKQLSEIKSGLMKKQSVTSKWVQMPLKNPDYVENSPIRPVFNAFSNDDIEFFSYLNLYRKNDYEKFKKKREEHKKRICTNSNTLCLRKVENNNINNGPYFPFETRKKRLFNGKIYQFDYEIQSNF